MNAFRRAAGAAALSVALSCEAMAAPAFAGLFSSEPGFPFPESDLLTVEARDADGPSILRLTTRDQTDDHRHLYYRCAG